MTTDFSEIAALGFDRWFQDQADPDKIQLHQIARVTSVHKDSYQLSKGANEVFAEASGKLLYSVESPLDFPAVGDWVYADFFDDDTHAIIHEVLPRKNVLKRKSAGKNIEFQLIASNIDIAFIVQSLDHNFNLRRLERYLVMVNESSIKPVILLSKCDLATEQEIKTKIDSITEMMPDLTVVAFSNETGMHLDDIKQLFNHGMTCCLLGSSGVGKSTLLNSVNGREILETGSVREKDSKGRHTTTHRQLVRLANGAMLIDTPGMRELGTMSADAGIDDTFSEIVELSQHCKFADCTHTNQKGCAILAAIEDGSLPEERFRNFLSMKKESDFNDMSYLEKRQKDKQFGKHIKSVMKHKKR